MTIHSEARLMTKTSVAKLATFCLYRHFFLAMNMANNHVITVVHTEPFRV